MAEGQSVEDGSHAMAPSQVCENPDGRTVRGQTVDGLTDGWDAVEAQVERMRSEDRERMVVEVVEMSLGNSAMVQERGLPAEDVSVRVDHLPS
jgi:hypothetical protein